MELDDFADWYGEVFEKTCKSCHNEKYHECTIRRVLMKYGVYPVDEAAVDRCQYKYSGARNAESINLMLVNAGGGSSSLSVSPELAESILSELRDRHGGFRGICAARIGDKLICVDTKGITAVMADGIGEWRRDKTEDDYVEQCLEEKELYHIDGRCGAEYTCSMNTGREKARCRDCQSAVFADRGAGKVDIGGDGATLMTNRYWVERGA